MILTVAWALTATVPVAGAEVAGIVESEPASGRFVRIADGYMVPYRVAIPGTDASFWMEPIPGGQFRMGSPATEKGREDIEGPQTTWTVDPFWMGRCEVTQGEFRHYMKMYTVFKQFKYRGYTKITDENRADAVTAPTVLYEPTYIFELGDHVDMPMVTMTHYAASQYAKWLSLVTKSQFRLPTEAEWEYACRAGTTTAWHFGDDPKELAEYAWFAGNSYNEGLRKVGTRKPNPWGLYDMHGNVAEWVLDHCAKYPDTDRVRNAATDWVAVDRVDPKSVRGGCCLFAAERCRSASRLPSDMDAWRDIDPDLPPSPWWLTTDPARAVGMRLVRPLKTMTREEQTRVWEPLDEETRFDVESRLEEGRGALGHVSPRLLKAMQTNNEE